MEDEAVVQLVTAVDDGVIRCEACQWQCVLAADEAGRCKVRVGAGNQLDLRNFGMISAASIGPVEDFRLWHFFPTTRVLSIGGWGYALPGDQQRGAYADIPDDPAKQRRLEPERAANVALEKLCRGVVWGYAEPSVSYEYVRELFQFSRAASRFTAMVTSGYLTMKALDGLGHYLDGVSLDLRGFSDAAYQRLGGISDWRGILAVIEHALKQWRCHIEVTTRIHHGVNDNPDEIRALVDWIGSTLGTQTPWHVLSGDLGAETAAAVMRARRIAHEQGLQFVYGSEPNQATRCPTCQATLISRENGLVRIVGLNGEQCDSCGAQIYLRTSIFKAR